MFSTPVGGAALLGVIFTLVLLWLLFAPIVNGIKRVSNGVKARPGPSMAHADDLLPASARTEPSSSVGEKPPPSIDEELETRALDSAYWSITTDLAGLAAGSEERRAARQFIGENVWYQVELWRRTQIELAQLRGAESEPDSSTAASPADGPVEDRKARLVSQWRIDIGEAQGKSHTYRPDLGDARPRLEEYGLTLGETVEERISLYRECQRWCKDANDAYDKAYYRIHGEVPVRPNDLSVDTHRPQPPRSEDFWLTPEDLEDS